MALKKRPDLLSADFTGGQAHAISPLATESLGGGSVSTAGGSVLETLPETGAETSPVSPSDRKSPRREWKPPIEKTDVVGAMEAIEGLYNRPLDGCEMSENNSGTNDAVHST